MWVLVMSYSDGEQVSPMVIGPFQSRDHAEAYRDRWWPDVLLPTGLLITVEKLSEPVPDGDMEE